MGSDEEQDESGGWSDASEAERDETKTIENVSSPGSPDGDDLASDEDDDAGDDLEQEKESIYASLGTDWPSTEFWTNYIKESTQWLRDELGEQTRPLSLASLCTGMWGEGQAAQVPLMYYT